MNELLSALSLWLIDFGVVATALLAASALALWLTRQPALRMAIAWGTMAGLSMLAVATALPNWPRIDVRQWSVPVHHADAEPTPTPIVTIEDSVPQPAALPPAAIAAPALLPALAAAPLSPARVTSWHDWLIIGWLAAGGLALAWIALGALQAWRLLWAAIPSPPWVQTELARLVGKRRKPRLKTSTRIGSAVALGVLRPAIVLPAEHVREENRAGVLAALAHEWAHIRHGDLWMLAWQRLLLPLLAVHPLFWLLRRQIRADQELLADLAAAGERPVEYAEALLDWARQSGPRPSAGLAALAMWEHPQTVSRRIQMILDPKQPGARSGSWWSRFLLLAGMAGMVVGLSLISVRPQPVTGQDQGAAAGQRVDSPAIEQMKLALEQLRAEAAQNAKARQALEQETTRLRHRVEELMTQLAYLRSLAGQAGNDKVTDDVFIRRVYLDLLGIVPTAEDIKAFLEDKDAQKREKLIDKLLADPNVAKHWARSWKEAIAGEQPPSTEPKPDELVSPAAPETTVAVIHLRYAVAEEAAKTISDVFQGQPESQARIVADARTNSLIIQGTPQQSQTLAAMLKVIDQPSAPQAGSARRADDPTSSHEYAGHDSKTQRRLLEIDLAQAEAEMELATAELEEVKKLGNAVSASELRKKEASLHHARLKRERAKVLLESVIEQEQSADRSPLKAIQEAMLPPKNLPEQVWNDLGLRLEPTNDGAFKKLDSAFRGGLTITDVRTGSPADDRGLLKGDILVGLGRWEMRSLENVVFALEHLGEGDLPGIYDEANLPNSFTALPELSFHILRDGKLLVGRIKPSRGDRTRPANPLAADKAADAGLTEDLAIKIRLAEIDLREAQLQLEADQLKFDRMAEIAKKGPGTVSQHDLDAAKLTFSQSQLAVERAKTVLDGLRSQATNRTIR